jgi:uncharacterized membrane protein YjgN (DUF898 family)
MVGLSFWNFFLRIITLGIHGFWGKTEVRRRIWSGVRLNGEPLQYSGTGMELFLGFLIVFGLILLPIFAVTTASAVYFGPESPIAISIQFALYAFIGILLAYGIYRATRYRLSRTTWRGIRGGLEGSAHGYAWTSIWTGLLIPLTLGWIVPWRTTKLRTMLVNNMRFGDRPLRFDASSGPLYLPYAAIWLGVIATYAALIGGFFVLFYPKVIESQISGAPPNFSLAEIGIMVGAALGAIVFLSIVGSWYSARTMNHFAAHTHYEGARFAGTATAGGLIWIGLSNFLLVIFSLGILTPIAQARMARYQVDNLKILGAVPLAAIAQGAAKSGSAGEGLAQAFDFDAV